MTYSAFFQPADGWVGDIIPVEVDGVFWLYYLLEQREDPKPGTPWALVTTKDFVRFDDRGIAFEHGGQDAPDFNVYTGSVVRDAKGLFHLFYTGQNPARLGEDGNPLQVVLRATSDDGMTSWQRDPQWELQAPAGYESGDWRDPFVFADPHTGQWRMLVAGRRDQGPSRRRGVIAQLTSNDLLHWTLAEPFWDPRRYIMHECPEVFRWGSWWYLVYSEFSETFTTRYRISTSPHGPWTIPDRDTIDGRAFYASKSAAFGDRRFFFGWVATKEADTDNGAWQWAGTMSTLEASQNPDGTLGLTLPRELVDSFDAPVDLTMAEQVPCQLRAPDGYRAVVSHEDAPSRFLATVVFDLAADTTEAGLLLRSSGDGDEAYVVRLEPRRQRMVFDRWPRRTTGPAQWQVSGDVPFELERPCDLGPGGHTLQVLVEDDVLVAVLDEQVALSARMYDRRTGRLGVFVGEGSADVLSLTVRERADT
jgi:beta-fructofuranosidase